MQSIPSGKIKNDEESTKDRQTNAHKIQGLFFSLQINQTLVHLSPLVSVSLPVSLSVCVSLSSCVSVCLKKAHHKMGITVTQVQQVPQTRDTPKHTSQSARGSPSPASDQGPRSGPPHGSRAWPRYTPVNRTEVFQRAKRQKLGNT